MTRFLHKFLDSYIARYHSTEFIHKTQYGPEIEKAIKEENLRVNALRDIQEREKLENQAMDFFIRLERHKAENRHLRGEIKEFEKQKKEVKDLRHAWYSRSDKLQLMALKMKSEGEILHKNTNSFYGAITAIYNEITANANDTEKADEKERKVLGR